MQLQFVRTRNNMELNRQIISGLKLREELMDSFWGTLEATHSSQAHQLLGFV